MLRWFKEFWVPGPLVEFESTVGLSESIARLKSVARTPASGSLQERVGGIVTARRVSLYRAIKNMGNSFKPVFRGRFVQRDGKVVLTGRFTSFWIVRGFMALWFAGLTYPLGLILVAASQSGASESSVTIAIRTSLISLAPLAMMALGVAFVSFARRASRSDSAWLSDVIRETINPAGDGASTSPALEVTLRTSSPEGKSPRSIWETAYICASVVLGAVAIYSLSVVSQIEHQIIVSHQHSPTATLDTAIEIKGRIFYTDLETYVRYYRSLHTFIWCWVFGVLGAIILNKNVHAQFRKIAVLWQAEK